MSLDLRRRVAAEHGPLIDKLINDGALPIPLNSFHNSLFREIEFANKADTDWFDLIAFSADLQSY